LKEIRVTTSQMKEGETYNASGLNCLLKKGMVRFATTDSQPMHWQPEINEEFVFDGYMYKVIHKEYEYDCTDCDMFNNSDWMCDAINCASVILKKQPLQKELWDE
jgi:hypothetical protein